MTSELKLKLTIAQEENPDLYFVLQAIHNPRRRTQRLKDLALKGLLFERGHVAPHALPPAPKAEVKATVSSMLDWSDQPTT